MSFIDWPRRLRRHLGIPVTGLVLGACSTPMAPEKPVTLLPAPAPAPGVATPSAPSARTGPVVMPLPTTPRNWREARLQAAHRLVAAHPDTSYMGKVPEVLLAIPVLEVELNADGSVRRIEVLRYPRQARDTVQLASDAIRRAAPYGNVARLPKPWKFTETFLFDDQRRFKPRTLDE